MNIKKYMPNILLIEATIVLIFGFLGSLYLADETKTKYVDDYEYRSNYEDYDSDPLFEIGDTKLVEYKEFNVALFFVTLTSSIILSSILYAGSIALDCLFEINQFDKKESNTKKPRHSKNNAALIQDTKEDEQVHIIEEPNVIEEESKDEDKKETSIIRKEKKVLTVNYNDFDSYFDNNLNE